MDSSSSSESKLRSFQSVLEKAPMSDLTPAVELSVLEAPVRNPDQENDVNRGGQGDRPRKSEGRCDERRAQEQDDQEHPATWKLILITTGLCMAVFCMALVIPSFACPSQG